MPRFFIPPEGIREGRFSLTGTEAHHAIHVLRQKVGDTIDLFDGKDASYRGRIEFVSSDALTGLLLETHQRINTLPEVTLYQALLKGPKWDWLIEKVCELGVHRLVPVLTARTIVQVGSRDTAPKVERWERIALAASKQCGRPDRMKVDRPQPLASVLTASSDSALCLIPWEKENSKTIRQACRRFQGEKAHIFVGPEGGWEQDEVASAIRAGYMPVSLGATLLRAETAGIVASALVLYELGDQT